MGLAEAVVDAWQKRGWLVRRFAGRPRLRAFGHAAPTLPGTDLIVYSTLLHEPADVCAGMLIGLASTAHLFGLGVVCGVRTLKHWREEGLV